jgi:hypothetical protein
MDLIAAPATAGAWVDSDFPLSPHTVSALVSAGKVGVVRYVPLPRNSSAGDISKAELEAICGGGLELMLVQHPRYPGWDPAKESGDDDAASALAKAVEVGYPHGAHLYLDLEGIRGSPYATISYAVDWQHTLIAGLLSAGAYIGFGVPLHPTDLYELPGFSSYWTDPANRQVATRGCAMRQGPEVTIGGVKFDLDALSPDLLGGLPFACKLAQPAPAIARGPGPSRGPASV